MTPGTLLSDRFVIEREAGAGGMGTVYRARDRLTGEAVAVKVLRDGTGVDAHRLAREASVLASLTHPGIVRHVAHGTTPNGRPFLAMEWLEGATLSQRLREGTPSVADAIRIVRGAAEALGAAHARGIVHRDVKPGNLFLVGGDPCSLKVLDFGIARRTGDQSLSLTTTGTVLGTPFYMAPEQARGQRAIDARADVWALGCVLYELLAGRPPFHHEQVVAVLAAILLEQPTPITELRADAPPALEAFLSRVLAKDPDARPEDGSALVRELDALGPIREAGSSSPSFAPRALTEREQRIVCLVLVERGVGARADDATIAVDGGESLEGRVRAAAEAHQGRVEVLADGSLIVDVGDRGTPTDHAARAARCALALRAILPDAAIAVTAGRAVILGRLPVGEVIESGARLLAHPAPRGTPRPIRVDDVIAGLLEGRFEFERDDHGRLLGAERREPDSGRTLLGRPSPCVGRDRELAMLEALYDECVTEPIARAVVVTAPAGVGKSRLVSELLRRLETRVPTPTVLSARGDPIASGSPLGLLAQALRAAAGIADREPIAVRRAKLRARVGAHVAPGAADRVAAMLGEIARVPVDGGEDEALRAARRDPQLRSDFARRALEDFLAAECSAAPVILVLDDLHHGDRASLAFVDAALRHLARHPFLVLAVGRTEIDEIFPDLFAEHDPQIVRLGRLTPRAARALAESALRGHGPADDALIQRLVDRADGNAFFLEELVRVAASGDPSALPESVLGMIEARLAALDAESRRVLRAASVFGASAPRSGILALLGVAGATAAIEDRLRELGEREVLVRREGQDGEPSYAFRSALVREAAYAMLTDDDRTLGHRLAAEHLEARGPDGVDPVVLAEHWDRGGDRARAARLWALAADRALDGDDLAAALARAERGLSTDPPPEVRAPLLRAKAAVHRWRGEYATALAVAREATSLERPGTNGFVDAASIVISAAGQLGRGEEIDALIPSILAPAEPAAVGAHIVALCRAAAQLLARDRARADELVAHAVRLAATLADDALAFGWIEVIRASRALRDGDVGAFVTATEAAVEFYERAGDARDACNQRVRLGNGWTALGEPGLAEPVLRAALADAERIGLPLIEGYALQNLGHALALQNRAGEARDAEARAIAIAKRLGDSVLEAGARLYLSDVELAAGAPESALAHARAAVELLAEVPPFRAVAVAQCAMAELARGEIAAARASAEKAAAELARDPRGLEEGQARIHLALVSALAASGEPFAAQASEARDALVSRAARISDPRLREGFLRRVPEHARLIALAPPA